MKEATWERKERELKEWIDQQAAEMAKLSPIEQAEEMAFRQKMAERLPEFVRHLENEVEELMDESEKQTHFIATLAAKYPETKVEILAYLTDLGEEEAYYALLDTSRHH